MSEQYPSTKFPNSIQNQSLIPLKHHSEAKNNSYNKQMEYIPINQLKPMNNQPRKIFDETSLQELAQSMKTYGILQPLVVTMNENNELFIIAGERRWRAAKLAGITEVPCVLRNIDEHSLLELALIENIQRENLSTLEEAYTIKDLINEFDYTHEVLASRLGKNRATVTNLIRILALPEKIKADLNANFITAGHARVLCGLETEKLQLKAHETIVQKKLSVRQTEDLIRNLKKEKEPKKLQDLISADLRYVCDQFKGHLGTKVKIEGDTNRGKIEISYYTMDDLERISELILGNIESDGKD